jgi:phage-related protein
MPASIGRNMSIENFTSLGPGATSRSRCTSTLSVDAGYGIVSMVSPKDKPLVVLGGEIRTPPLSAVVRVEAGYLLRRLQKGDVLSLPHSRPMPSIGRRVHELRIQDPATSTTWRIVYRADPFEIVVVDVFAKKSQATPKQVIERCKQRLRVWDDDERS